MIKVRKGRLRFVVSWSQPAIAYRSSKMLSSEVIYVPAETAVPALGPHMKLGTAYLYVEVLSCVGVVWIEMRNLTNGPEQQ